MRLPCIPNYPIDYLIVLRWNHNTVQLKIQLLWENVCFVNIQLKTQSNFVILQLPTSFRSSFVWASKCWDRIGGVRRCSFFIPWFIDFISAMLYLSFLSFLIWLLWNISLFILWFIDFIYWLQILWRRSFSIDISYKPKKYITAVFRRFLKF